LETYYSFTNVINIEYYGDLAISVTEIDRNDGVRGSSSDG